MESREALTTTAVFGAWNRTLAKAPLKNTRKPPVRYRCVICPNVESRGCAAIEEVLTAVVDAVVTPTFVTVSAAPAPLLRIWRRSLARSNGFVIQLANAPAPDAQNKFSRKLKFFASPVPLKPSFIPSNTAK